MNSGFDDLSDFGDERPIQKNKPSVGRRIFEVFAVLGAILLLVALFLPAVRSGGGRAAARRSQCVNNLKQIGLALHNYVSTYDSLPPAYTTDANGKPLHSWRTLILPFMEQQRLYETIDLSKPWDDPANATALETAIGAYQCPAATIPANQTTYLGVVGPSHCFHPTRPRTISEFTDGTSNTIAVIEMSAEHAVPWMAPMDANESMVMAFGVGKTLNHPGGANALFLDGSVKFLKASISSKVLAALISIAGNETLSADDY